ncbi:LysM domain protein [Rhizoctonia solani AG-1 IB]|uniref:LysM domain protein n=1 Tax=Thanatephorus cucumeris (strain AG1-IB / isolate 7/3/14) TaxID=1108050 RepID=M5BVJ6_THACB|nr:LysM domain protein [Rhizoctonia solani AG-1 IB]
MLSISHLVSGYRFLELRPTGNWCSQLFNSSWPGTSTDQGVETLPTSVLCSSCVTQSLLISQQSVIGYDPDFISAAWPTIQSKCGITTSIKDPGQAHINLPAPTGTSPGAPTNCGRWYIVSAGETCNTVILSQGITMADFRAANPQINNDCTNLWADTAYCVYQVIKGPVPSSYANAPSTIAHGTTTNCYQYYTAVSGDTCTAISYSQVASVEDILRWNLGLNAQCTNLAVGSSYCVWGDPKGATTTAITSTGSALQTATLANPSLTASFSCTYTWCDGPINTAPVTTTSTASSAAPTSTGVPRPGNAAPNSTTSCKKWYTVVSGDYCYLICQNQGCTVPNLQTWNPDLGANCVAQLGVAYCVSA